jgi:hypothetical protein
MAAEIETDGDFAADLAPFLRAECDSIGISEADVRKLVVIWRMLGEPPPEGLVCAAEGFVAVARRRRSRS